MQHYMRQKHQDEIALGLGSGFTESKYRLQYKKGQNYGEILSDL